MTEKEASKRYGYSTSWFYRARLQKNGPPFIQLRNHTRVLYPLEQTDKWFTDRMNERE